MCRHYFITGLWTNNNVAKSLFIHCVEHWPQIPDCNMYYFSLAKVWSRYLAGLMFSSTKKYVLFHSLSLSFIRFARLPCIRRWTRVGNIFAIFMVFNAFIGLTSIVEGFSYKKKKDKEIEWITHWMMIAIINMHLHYIVALAPHGMFSTHFILSMWDPQQRRRQKKKRKTPPKDTISLS